MASEAIYDSGLPILKVDHQEGPKWSPDLAKRREQIRMFIFDICQAEADWNVDNFIKNRLQRSVNRSATNKVVGPFRRCRFVGGSGVVN